MMHRATIIDQLEALKSSLERTGDDLFAIASGYCGLAGKP